MTEVDLNWTLVKAAVKVFIINVNSFELLLQASWLANFSLAVD